MKKLFFLALMLFCLPSLALGKEVARYPALDGKKIAIENTDGIVVINGKEKTTIHSINPRFEAYHLVQWTPKSNAVIFLVSKIGQATAEWLDCEEEICPRSMQLYLYKLGSKKAKGKTVPLEKTLRDITSGSFGGIITIPFRPNGTDALKEVCQYGDKKCTPKISFGDKNFSYSLNLYYFNKGKGGTKMGEEETSAQEMYIAEKVPGDKDDGCHLYYKSVTITRDYNGKLIKTSKPFFVKDLYCGRD